MQINYLGHSCFKIKGKKTTILTDPFDKYIGFSLPQTSADIVTISHAHQDHNFVAGVEGHPFIINAPGEYEIGEVSIFGLNTWHDEVKGLKRGKNIVFVIHFEEIALCHLGDLGHKLSDRELEEIGSVDVLFVPVGGAFTLDPKKAMEAVNQIEPALVVPMHYKTSLHDEQAFGALNTLKDFLVESGNAEIKIQDKLLIAKNTLPEEREIIPLSFK